MPHDTLTITGKNVQARSPEGVTATMGIADFVEKINPPTMNCGGLILPRGVATFFSTESTTIMFWELPPAVHHVRWISADSEVPFKMPGASVLYEDRRIALPYVVIVAVFAKDPAGRLVLTGKNEAYFRTAPIQSRHDELMFPALLNISKFPKEAAATKAPRKKVLKKARRKRAGKKKVAKRNASLRRVSRPFPWRPLEEALKIPLAIREKNNGNPWTTDDVAKASLGVVKGNRKFFYAGAAYGFGLGFAVRIAEEGSYPGTVGDFWWRGLAGTYFWIDPRKDLFAIFMIQDPANRMHYTGVTRNWVYGAVKD